MNTYQFTLFTCADDRLSRNAIKAAGEFFEKYLPGRYTLEIVDIVKNPGVAGENRIFTIPTLIRTKPQPEARVFGDLSQTEILVETLLEEKDLPSHETT